MGYRRVYYRKIGVPLSLLLKPDACCQMINQITRSRLNFVQAKCRCRNIPLKLYRYCCYPSQLKTPVKHLHKITQHNLQSKSNQSYACTCVARSRHLNYLVRQSLINPHLLSGTYAYSAGCAQASRCGSQLRKCKIMTQCRVPNPGIVSHR